MVSGESLVSGVDHCASSWRSNRANDILTCLLPVQVLDERRFADPAARRLPKTGKRHPARTERGGYRNVVVKVVTVGQIAAGTASLISVSCRR